MKRIRYDRHAKRRMKEREVTEEEVEITIKKPEDVADTGRKCTNSTMVEITIKKPEDVEPSVKGRKNAYKFMNGRFLRVTLKEESNHMLVITVTIRKRPFKG